MAMSVSVVAADYDVDPSNSDGLLGQDVCVDRLHCNRPD